MIGATYLARGSRPDISYVAGLLAMMTFFQGTMAEMMESQRKFPAVSDEWGLLTKWTQHFYLKTYFLAGFVTGVFCCSLVVWMWNAGCRLLRHLCETPSVPVLEPCSPRASSSIEAHEPEQLSEENELAGDPQPVVINREVETDMQGASERNVRECVRERPADEWFTGEPTVDVGTPSWPHAMVR